MATPDTERQRPVSAPLAPFPRILIGCTGSVASLKVPALVDALNAALPATAELKVVTTQPALHFFDRAHVNCDVLTDPDEWSAWTKRDDPVLHIELRNWADVVVIAPLDANTLAKVAGGLCDNLLVGNHITMAVLKLFPLTVPSLVGASRRAFSAPYHHQSPSLYAQQ